MNMDKKVLVGLVVAGMSALALSVGFIYFVFSQFFGSIPNHVATDYVEGKYGLEVDVIGKERDDFNSPTEFTVSPKDDPELKFTVTVEWASPGNITDTYEANTNWMDATKKMEGIASDIENLGFTGVEGEPMSLELDEVYGGSYLNLETDKQIDYNNFIEENLDTYYALYELIKKNQIGISSVSIYNPGTGDEAGKELLFHLDEPEEVLTKEAFMSAMKIDNMEFVNSEIENRFEKEALAIKNERFHLGDNYDDTENNPYDNWFSCSEVDQKGKCVSSEMYVSYINEGFYPEYPHLKEDFTAILKFAEAVEREAKVDEIHLEGIGMTDSEEVGKQFRLGYDELPSHNSMDDFIDSIRKEMQY